MKALKLGGLLVMALCIAVTAYAHHSAAGIDQTKTVTQEGIVKQFKWANPHSWLAQAGNQTPSNPAIKSSSRPGHSRTEIRAGFLLTSRCRTAKCSVRTLRELMPPSMRPNRRRL